MKSRFILAIMVILLFCIIVTDSYSWVSFGQSSTSELKQLIGVKASLTNLDSENNSPIARAVFELCTDKGELLGRYVTDKNGVASLGEINSGEEYHATNISAPYGYELDKSTHIITAQNNRLIIKSKRQEKEAVALSIKGSISNVDYAGNEHIATQAELDFPFEYMINIGDDKSKSYLYEIKNHNGQLISPYSYSYEDGRRIEVLARGEISKGDTLYLKSGETAYISYENIAPLTEYEIIPKDYAGLNLSEKISGYLMLGSDLFGYFPSQGIAAEFSYYAIDNSLEATACEITILNQIENPDKSDYEQEFLTTIELFEDKQYFYEVIDVTAKTKDKPLLSNGNQIKVLLKHNQAIKIYGALVGSFYKVSQESPDGYFVFKTSNTFGNARADLKATIINKRIFEKSNTIRFEIKRSGNEDILNKEITAQIIDIKSKISYKSFSFSLKDGFLGDFSLPVYEYMSREKLNYGIKLSLPDEYYIYDVKLSEDGFLVRYDKQSDSVSIGIRNIIDGNQFLKEEFRYDINAVEPNTPLPPIDSSAYITDEGIAFFNPIKFNPKGADGKRLYKYIVTQRKGQAKGFSYAQNSFEVLIEVIEKSGACMAKIVEIKGGYSHDGLLLFENQYTKDEAPELSRLIIRKIVEAKEIDYQEKFNFVAKIGEEKHEFELAHGQTKSFEDIPIGTAYEVFEEENEKYKVEGFGVKGEIEKEESVAVFINTPIPKKPPNKGSLTVYKELYGNELDQDKKFRFTVIIDGIREQVYLSGGESITFNNLKEGARYSVAERDYSDEGYKSYGFNKSGVINEYGNIALFFNIKKPIEKSFLSVTNEVWKGDYEKQFEYMAQIGEEKHEFSLSSGEIRLFEDIKVDTPYEIIQKDYSDEGYITLAFSQSGVIFHGGIDATFVNIKEPDEEATATPPIIEDEDIKQEEISSDKPFEALPQVPSEPPEKEDEESLEIRYPFDEATEVDLNGDVVSVAFGMTAVGACAIWIYAGNKAKITSFAKKITKKILSFLKR